MGALDRAILGAWAASVTATSPCHEGAHKFMYVYKTYIVIYLTNRIKF